MYIRRKQDTDLPYLATGYFIAGVLLLGVPVLFNPRTEGVKTLRQVTTLLAVTSSIASGCFHRKIHKVLVPQWQEIDELESEYKLKTIDLELSEEFDKRLIESSARATQHAQMTLEAEIRPTQQLEQHSTPTRTSDAPMAAQRLLDELLPEQRDELLKKYEKTLEAPPSKDSSDLDAMDIPSTRHPEQLAENKTDATDIQAQIEQVKILVQLGGLKLADAVKKVSGSPSNTRKYRELRDAYKAKYGDV